MLVCIIFIHQFWRKNHEPMFVCSTFFRANEVFRKRTKNGRKDKRALGRLRRIINPLSPRGAPNRDRSKLAGAGLRSGRILRRDGRRIPKKMWRAVNFGITRIPNTKISPELVEKNLGSRAEILAIRRIARISTAAQLPADLDVQPLPDPAAAILRIHRGGRPVRAAIGRSRCPTPSPPA